MPYSTYQYWDFMIATCLFQPCPFAAFPFHLYLFSLLIGSRSTNSIRWQNVFLCGGHFVRHKCKNSNLQDCATRTVWRLWVNHGMRKTTPNRCHKSKPATCLVIWIMPVGNFRQTSAVLDPGLGSTCFSEGSQFVIWSGVHSSHNIISYRATAT